MENKAVIYVGIGDFKIGKGATIIKTCLGSCVGICLYDKEKKVGGMLHIMLPNSQENKGNIKLAKYADTGIKELIRVMEKEHNALEKDLVAKIFGGAKVLKPAIHDIGKSNVIKVKEILKERNIKLLREKTGGDKGYKIAFDVETGLVTCQIYQEQEEVF